MWDLLRPLLLFGILCFADSELISLLLFSNLMKPFAYNLAIVSFFFLNSVQYY